MSKSRYFYASSRKAYREKSNSEEIIQTSSQSSTDHLLQCNKCDFTTKSAYELRSHSKIHIDKPNSMRKRNNPKFQRNSSQTKASDMMFECRKCDEGFNHKDEQDLHMEYFHQNTNVKKSNQE